MTDAEIKAWLRPKFRMFNDMQLDGLVELLTSDAGLTKAQVDARGPEDGRIAMWLAIHLPDWPEPRYFRAPTNVENLLRAVRSLPKNQRDEVFAMLGLPPGFRGI